MVKILTYFALSNSPWSQPQFVRNGNKSAESELSQLTRAGWRIVSTSTAVGPLDKDYIHLTVVLESANAAYEEESDYAPAVTGEGQSPYWTAAPTDLKKPFYTEPGKQKK